MVSPALRGLQVRRRPRGGALPPGWALHGHGLPGLRVPRPRLRAAGRGLARRGLHGRVRGRRDRPLRAPLLLELHGRAGRKPLQPHVVGEHQGQAHAHLRGRGVRPGEGLLPRGLRAGAGEAALPHPLGPPGVAEEPPGRPGHQGRAAGEPGQGPEAAAAAGGQGGQRDAGCCGARQWPGLAHSRRRAALLPHGRRGRGAALERRGLLAALGRRRARHGARPQGRLALRPSLQVPRGGGRPPLHQGQLG
mmetsp:Transcript_119181/g.384817  ORF Transcript_119181/g.384817 Transcript_119181/m.384817 type:complete len:249 (-) Transcript_119181:755-1501(-)